MNVVGLKPNFEIRPADIYNAAAVNYGGKRFILYDPAFMANIQNATQTDWAAISILAHEIGHHLNGHTMMTKGGNPALELEADE
ncbi:MAG: membrane-binding protein, partial [Bacteroidota bacterium]|nr:membrane-binding protein [Bacteroidota bacterium]